LDAAKAIALMLKHPEEDSSYLFRAGGDDSHLPLCLIPTTCGTGSEVTGVSVLTRNDIKTKQSISFKIFGDIALLDGKYLESLSPKVLKNTAMDAFCHLVESYVNNNATIYSRIVCLDGLSSFENVLPVIKGEKKPELSDYFNLLRTSTYAGMAIAQTGTAIPHGLSYAFTYNLGIEHGRACGYFLAGYLKMACKKWTCLSEELSNYFKTNQDNKFNTVGEAEVNLILNTAGIASVEEFEKLYALVCEKVEVEEAKLNKELDNTVNDLFNNKAKLSVAPFQLSKEELTEIAYDISR
ncbi:MAG: iron-containing alcohol dehydrogenase, partial [Lachnospira sp.]|nr:iron-containing alcohol dehydrogenase [Lachnospira sp.]